MSWLRLCLSVDAASRPTIHQILQQPFFLRLAAQEYLQAVAQQEAEEARAAGEAEGSGEAGGAGLGIPIPPWFARPASPPRRGSGSSSSSWEGLPPFKPMPPAALHAASDSDFSLPGSFRIESSGPEGMYSHLDPEVVAEMERLQMIER